MLTIDVNKIAGPHLCEVVVALHQVGELVRVRDCVQPRVQTRHDLGQRELRLLGLARHVQAHLPEKYLIETPQKY